MRHMVFANFRTDADAHETQFSFSWNDDAGKPSPQAQILLQVIADQLGRLLPRLAPSKPETQPVVEVIPQLISLSSVPPIREGG